jgi:threonine/homoserine/homoserine lactone efflux protein
MQDFVGFFAAVILVSASGVMAPGPLFASTISSAIRYGRLAGLKIAAGHTVVELPLVVVLGLGMVSLESMSGIRIAVSVIGAVGIFAFAGIQLRAVFRPNQPVRESRHGSFLTGLFLTGLNPFFLVWWFTIGIKLISDALALWPLWGVFVMFGMHIWMDYVWLFFVSALSAGGTRFLTDKRYKVCMVAVNAALIYFGVSFIVGIV